MHMKIEINTIRSGGNTVNSVIYRRFSVVNSPKFEDLI
jgi:hypothetical protein